MQQFVSNPKTERKKKRKKERSTHTTFHENAIVSFALQAV